MSIVSAFLVAFLTSNILVLTGIGVATFEQSIQPTRMIIQRGALLTGFTIAIALIIQVELLQPILPLLVLVSVYAIALIEKQLAKAATVSLEPIEIVALGGALTVFGALVAQFLPNQFDFYAAAAGMVTTYLVTLTALQLLQRRLKLAQVPSLMVRVPLLALTLAILAMVFSGFTAIF